MTFIIKADKKEHGEGFGIWFSEVNPYQNFDILDKDPTVPTALGLHVFEPFWPVLMFLGAFYWCWRRRCLQKVEIEDM